MSERQIITISDDKLSCEATAILLRMLNFSDTDYHTAEELCPFFENDSLKTIRNRSYLCRGYYRDKERG